MIELERETLNNFLKVAGKLSVTEYGRLLGIERTRFFRLMHGADMKVKELVSIQLYIKKQKGESVDWSDVMGKLVRESETASYSGGESEGVFQFERYKRLRGIINQTAAQAA